MSTSAQVQPSRKLYIAGLTLTSLVALFLLFDTAGKLAKVAAVVKGTAELCYSESIIIPLGIILFACTLLYLFPHTAVLGAILLTGYLGGAVATHARISNPLFSHTLFPVYIGLLVWLSIYLRDRRLREILFLRRPY